MNEKKPTVITNPAGAAVERFVRRHGRLPTQAGDRDPAKETVPVNFDYTRLDGPMLMFACGDDGAKWGVAFCQHAKKIGLDIEEGWAIGWFANAIETATDFRRQAGRNK